MVFAVIVAGGVGSRLKVSDKPKQFLDLCGKPIIIRTIEKFLKSKRIDKVYVGVHPDWLDYTEHLLEEFFVDRQCDMKSSIVVVAGGKDRNDTLFNVIAQIENDFGNNFNDVIITHDAVRPFVSDEMIENHIDAVLEYGAVDTAYGAIDTIVVSTDGKFIDKIPDRRTMFQSQTPQSFNIQKLKEIYASLTKEEKEILTDACKICVIRGCPVYIVEGAQENLKITTVADYKMAQRMIED